MRFAIFPLVAIAGASGVAAASLSHSTASVQELLARGYKPIPKHGGATQASPVPGLTRWPPARHSERPPAPLPFLPKRGKPINPSEAATASDHRKEELVLFHLTNNFRANQAARASLKWHDGWAGIARRHSENMARGFVPLGHSGVNNRFNKMNGAVRMGENVASIVGYDDPLGVAMEGWINSAGHRKNLEGDFTHVGIGAARSGDTWYFTQLFGLATA